MVHSSETTRQEFAERLQLAIDNYQGAPPRHRGRPAWLSKTLPFDISQKGVGKWFNAETMPSRANMDIVADMLGVSRAWLSTGEGEMVASSELMISRLKSLPPQEKVIVEQLIDSFYSRATAAEK